MAPVAGSRRRLSNTATSSAHCTPCGETIRNTALVFVGVLVLLVFVGVAGKRWWNLQRQLPKWKSRAKKAKGLVRVLALPGKVKILIGFCTITSRVGSVYEVMLPVDIEGTLNSLLTASTLGLSELSREMMTCAGVLGYLPRLLFWVAAPPCVALLLFLVVAATGSRGRRVGPERNGSGPGQLGTIDRHHRQTGIIDRWTPWVLRVLFVLYPAVTNVAFQAFPCYDFEEGSWLRADVAIQCGSPYHSQVKLVAWLAVAVYPMGLWVAALLLLRRARLAILPQEVGARKASAAEQRLAANISFLFAEYEPHMFWWELAEMGRRLLLVGLLVVIEPGTILQLSLGTIACGSYLMVQLQAKPYLNESDNFIALGSSFALLMMFFCCVLYKYNALTTVS